MSLFKGGYLGFSYGTLNPDGTYELTHSSDLGITRVSGGGRYDENLLPSIQDKTVQVPGGDGTYYFGSFYTNKTFSLAIAFDEVTDVQIRKMKQLFGDKKTHVLIFDETPYKVYTVKATGTPNLKYIPFEIDNPLRLADYEYDYSLHTKDELYNQTKIAGMARIFKGDGTLTFTAYTPYAYSRYKYINQYTLANIPEWKSLTTDDDFYYNVDEWSLSIGLKKSTAFLSRNNRHYVVDTPLFYESTGGTTVCDGVAYYNPGDFEAPFKMKFMYTAAGASVNTLTVGAPATKGIKIEAFTLNTLDYGFQINTKLNLIEGLDKDGNLTGNVYNRYITHGDFFGLDKTDDLTFLPIDGSNANTITLDYKYLFF